MSFVVWEGHRDYERNIVVCGTRARAEKYLADHGVKLRDDPAPQIKEQSLMGEDFTPWGIEEVEDV